MVIINWNKVIEFLIDEQKMFVHEDKPLYYHKDLPDGIKAMGIFYCGTKDDFITCLKKWIEEMV